MEWCATWNGTPQMDLAQEEAALSIVATSGRPLLFAYGWDRPVLVLGYGQDSSEVSLAACKEHGVTVVRRCTGGTGVLYTGDLALSLALPEAHPWAHSIGSLYDHFVAALQSGLEGLGVSATRGQDTGRGGPRSVICFENPMAETLLLDGKKVLGCAQARHRGAVLIHGALLLGVDAELQAEVYGVPPARIEALLGVVPRKSYDSRKSLAEHLMRSIAGTLGETTCPSPLAPPLTPEFAARRQDPKWLILGSEE